MPFLGGAGEAEAEAEARERVIRARPGAARRGSGPFQRAAAARPRRDEPRATHGTARWAAAGTPGHGGSVPAGGCARSGSWGLEHLEHLEHLCGTDLFLGVVGGSDVAAARRGRDQDETRRDETSQGRG
jgi:hypothetical protein